MLNTKYTEYDFCGIPHKQYKFSHNGNNYMVERVYGAYSGEYFTFKMGIPFSENSPSLIYQSIENENIAKELFKMFSNPDFTEEQIELWLELNIK